MNETKETIARALEIAIALTKADDTWLRMDENKNVFIKEPLLRTLEIVIKTMNADNLVNICNSGKSTANYVYPMR